MNKNELTAAVANASGQRRDVVESVINAVTDAVIEAVRSGDTVKLAGFGNFAPQFRPSRPGRNPRTGESVTIPESRSMKFKVSPAVTEHLSKR